MNFVTEHGIVSLQLQLQFTFISCILSEFLVSQLPDLALYILSIRDILVVYITCPLMNSFVCSKKYPMCDIFAPSYLSQLL